MEPEFLGKTLYRTWTTFTRIVGSGSATLSCCRAGSSRAKPQARHRPAWRSVRIETLSRDGFRQLGPALDAPMPTKGATGRLHAALASSSSSPRRGRCTSTIRTGVMDDDQYRLRPGLDDHALLVRGIGLSVGSHFRTTKARAVKISHAARPAGTTVPPSSPSHKLGWQAARRCMPSICSCRKPLSQVPRRGSWLRRNFARL